MSPYCSSSNIDVAYLKKLGEKIEKQGQSARRSVFHFRSPRVLRQPGSPENVRPATKCTSSQHCRRSALIMTDGGCGLGIAYQQGIPGKVWRQQGADAALACELAAGTVGVRRRTQRRLNTYRVFRATRRKARTSFHTTGTSSDSSGGTLKPSVSATALGPILGKCALPQSARVLITGGTGCIGSYVIAELLLHTNYTLELIVRGGAQRFLSVSDERFRFSFQQRRIRVHDVDLASAADLQSERMQQLVGTCDALVLCAASWGGDTANAVNVDAVLSLLHASTRQHRCRHVVYFATASVVSPQGKVLLEEALQWGTEYIQSKAIAVIRLLDTLQCMDKPVPTTILFPTLVLGPTSHLGTAFRASSPAALRDSPLYRAGKHVLRFLSVDSRVRAHFIHAADCAQIVRLVLQGASSTTRALSIAHDTGGNVFKPVQRNGYALPLQCFVVGQEPPFSFDDAVHALCRLYGLVIPMRWLRIPADPLLWLMAHGWIPVDAWTRFCLRRRRELFLFPQAVRPEDLGGTSVAPDLYTALQRCMIPSREAVGWMERDPEKRTTSQVMRFG